MAITQNREMTGSIGGGIMEHKLVLLAQRYLEKNEKAVTVKKQVHSKQSPENQSGMICSGEQTIVLIPLYPLQVATIDEIAKQVELKNKAYLQLNSDGLTLINGTEETSTFNYRFQSNTDWLYQEQINFQKTVHIIGAGHVGLALSRQMHLLNFHVVVYDNRPELNTLLSNESAHEKKVVEYTSIDQHIPDGQHHHVVIMTFGYRDDKIVLKALYQKRFAYLGMMGSKEKIRQLREELSAEGISQQDLEHVFMPIGLTIGSKTPQEIAVSIAAEIIRSDKDVDLF